METNDALWLVEIGESEPPLLAIIEHSFWDEDDEDGRISYFVDEHTCPVNLIGVEVLLWGDDTDPHGVVQFVQQVRKPADWPFVGECPAERYRALFNKLPEYMAARLNSQTAAPYTTRIG